MTEPADRSDLVVVELSLAALPTPVDVQLRFDLPSADAPNGVWLLSWTDNVANDWAERFDDLSVALLRTALLVRAVETDRFYAHQPTAFAVVSQAFLDQVLR